MTTWKKSKSQDDFPASFHAMIKMPVGKYLLFEKVLKDNRTKKQNVRYCRDRWSYFKWLIKERNVLSLLAHMKGKTYRICEEPAGVNMVNISIVISEDFKEVTLTGLSKALKGFEE